MAKNKEAKADKKPGRIKQMWQVYTMTRAHDKQLTMLLVLALIAPIVAGLLVAFIIDGNILTWILWPVTGLLVGVLLAMIILGRRAEAAAYRQIAGQPGAVGAVVKDGLRRSWRGNELPVAINPRTQDAIYRVVGKGGIVLVTDGPHSRTQRMRVDEERKVKRILPTVQVSHITVSQDGEGVPLEKLSRELTKIKNTLSKHEVLEIDRRLTSLQNARPGFGIPKGIDPTKVRPQKPR